MTSFFRVRLIYLVFLVTVAITDTRLVAATGQDLISRSAAEAHGLARAWFTQVRLDPGRGRVSHILFVEKSQNHPDTLFIQTDQAGLHVINAETGQTLWTKTVGRPSLPSLPLGVNEEIVALVNGTKLYILKRTDGKLLWTGRVNGAPTAGVAVSKRRVFVPTINGRMIGYLMKKAAEESILPGPAKEQTDTGNSVSDSQSVLSQTGVSDSLRLEQEAFEEISCGFSGQINSSPLIVRDDDSGLFITWTTSQGMFVAQIANRDDRHFRLLYELAGENEIAAPPTYAPPRDGKADQEGVIFVASLNGTIIAHSENHGSELWRRAIGQPIIESVVSIDGRLFAISALGGMYCLDAAKGDLKWTAENIMRFVAASPTRIYATDKFGRLLVLDAESGTVIDTLPFPAAEIMVCNSCTDRIYLISKTGLVQCLHEIELAHPVRHSTQEEAKPDAKNNGEAEDQKTPPEKTEAMPDPFA